MRLIDESKLIQAIIEERDKIPLTRPCAPYELLDVKPNSVGQSQRAGIRKALRCIAESPTVDAVEVVRCRDCKHWIEIGTEYFSTRTYGECRLLDDDPRYADDYCSDGERRENEQAGRDARDAAARAYIP
jgi:hypothetical protein